MTADATRWAEYLLLLMDYTDEEWHFGAYSNSRAALDVGRQLATKYSTAVAVRGRTVLLLVPGRDDGLYKRFRAAWFSGEDERERIRKAEAEYASHFEADASSKEADEWFAAKERDYAMSQEEYVRRHS